MKTNGLKIITVCYNTPKFIEYQYLLFKKYLLTDFEYIVYDNTGTHVNTIEYQADVIRICSELGIRRKSIKKEIYGIPDNGSLHFPDWDVSTRAGKSITYSIQECIKNENQTKILLVDMDMFLIAPLDLPTYYDSDIVGKPGEGTDNNGNVINYFTNQLFLFDVGKIKKKEMIDFMPNTINEINVDCGGNLYFLFKEQPELKIRAFENCLLSDIHNEYFNNELLDFLKRDVDMVNETHKQVNYFMEFYDYAFLHFRAGTNWIGIKDYTQRIDNLFNFLKSKL